ncbi:MAG: cyclase family protein [Thermoplasmata archaeon]
MKIHDLSLQYEDGMPYFEGDPKPEIRQFRTIAKDGYNLKEMHIGTHTGTHIDAPSHFIEGGEGVDELGLERLSGLATCIRYDQKEGIELPEQKFKIILLYTGYNERWGEHRVFRDYSFINAKDAEEIRRYGAKIVGIDSPSVEAPGSKNFEAHRILLGNSIVIAENLNSRTLSGIIGKVVFVMIFPLLVKGGDGAPSRIVALEGL